ncbi:MAG: ATP-binding protein [Bacteroidales bacterium]|jgi:signal transduction histidine kinase/ActR/RegA family two-component response regulator|nr:ATP-binding protein [Bacteroidales bacterium]HOI31744.1 ATP-binding protein [Bacteroidales bacterium]
MAYTIDSLEMKLSNSIAEDQPATRLKLAKAYLHFDTSTALRYLKEVVVDTQQSSLYHHIRIEALQLLAGIQAEQDNLDSANFNMNKALILLADVNYSPSDGSSKPFAELTQKKQTKPFSIYTVILVTGLLLLVILLILTIFTRIKLQKKLKSLQQAEQKLLQEYNQKEAAIEAEVKNRTAELEARLQERRAKDLKLKIALKKAEDANYLKNAFLSNMSHEIRTPLNGIIGFSSLLETELSLMENKILYEYAQGIQQSGDRLLNLLNNIIDISRIEANDIDIELHECAVNEILQNVIDLTIFAANEKSLAFKAKLEEVPPIIADNAKLMRVFHILVDNAIKYTNEGFVTIHSHYAPQNNRAVIKIKDTGVGMDEDYQHHLFEAFRQESSGYGRSYQGAGLGLPLAKRLLDLMQGEIQIDSKRNVGTTVSLSLPCKSNTTAKHLATSELPVPNAPEIGRLDIFIVEDDRMNRMVLQKILQKAGQITMAVDGEETLKIVGERHKKAHIFQVMLFDINLPSPWDGIQLMHKIKADFPIYKKIPFIAQTAYAMAGDREKMLEAGFDDYIAKPINKNELMTLIKNQLDKHSKLDQTIQ